MLRVYAEAIGWGVGYTLMHGAGAQLHLHGHPLRTNHRHVQTLVAPRTLHKRPPLTYRNNVEAMSEQRLWIRT